MSEITTSLKRIEERVRRKASEILEGTETKVRVLKVWALGPRDTMALIKWMKEGSMIQELLKENMELRGKYTYLEARLTMEADRIASRKLRRIFRAAREVSEGGEGEG